MINNTSTIHDAVAESRGGPLTQTLEERRGRTRDTNTRQRNAYQSVSKYTDPDCGAVPYAALKTQGEMEADICDGIRRFEVECLGRGPKDVRVHLIGDLIVLRLYGVLTVAERQLVTSLDAEKGRDLVKQVRTQLVESSRPLIEAFVKEVTGVPMISMYHDVCTTAGEECFLFTLAASPEVREIVKKQK